MKASTTLYDAQIRDNGLHFPCIISKVRSEYGKLIRRMYKNDIGVPYQAAKGYRPRADGIANTITTFQTDNQIMLLKQLANMNEELTYQPKPTKADLLDYFKRRIRIRKMVPKEAFRLQGLEDSEIEKIQAYPFTTLAERKQALAKADKTKRANIKKQSICKTAQFKLAGNSIDVKVLVEIFRTMFIPGQPENAPKPVIQPSLFD